MIRIKPQAIDDPEWQAWVQRAQAATDELVRAVNNGAPPAITPLYKECKSFFLAMFHEKCAYCETKITSGQPGDIDHFRPKSAVKALDGKPVKVKGAGGAEREHPGYYWLAYHWRNLLPACALCNRPNGHGQDRTGKWDYFPVAGERYASQPGEEAQESALLLNPMDDDFDPAQHFTWDATGVVGGKSEQGKMCIKLLGLNRDGLIDDRRRAYAFAYERYQLYMSDNLRGYEAKGILDELKPYVDGTVPYSGIGRAAIRESRKYTEQRRQIADLALEDDP